MSFKLRILTILSAGLWLQMAMPAAAQNRVQYSPTSYAPSIVPTYTSPAVSPYLNLGVTPDGLSNYQSLVRPMIDERNMLEKQSANLQQLQQQLQSRGPMDPRSRNPGARSPVNQRFLNYSHYYGGLR